tara:strand:- start:21 stop:341 length:321 start_codon:yes stop_codon:yes gene_type:complete
MESLKPDIDDLYGMTEDEARAVIKVFNEVYDEEYWEDFASSVRVFKWQKDIDDFLFDDFCEINEVPDYLEWCIDYEKVVYSHSIGHRTEEITTEEGYNRTVVWREI